MNDPQLRLADLADSSSGPPTAGRFSVAIDWILIAAIYLSYWVLLPHQLIADDWTRIQMVRRLAGLSTTMPIWVKFSMIQPVLMLPLFKLGPPFYWLLCFNCLMCGLGILGLYFALRRFVDRQVLRRFILILMGLSMVAHWTMYLDAEMFSAMATAVGLALLVTNRPWLAAVPLALGAANTPALLPALALAVGWHCYDRRCWRYMLIPALAVGIFMLECRFRRGGWFHNGYEIDAGPKDVMPYSGLVGFSYPLLFGLLGIFFSFGKGLIFFTPGLFLPEPRGMAPRHQTLRDFRMLALWFVTGLVLVYARFWAWYGGLCWGPRFFLFASIPASLMLAMWLAEKPLSLRQRVLLALLIVFCAWISINGAVFSLRGLGFAQDNDYALEHLTIYTAEYSPLWHPFVKMEPLESEDWQFIVLIVVTMLWLMKPLTTGLRDVLIFRRSPKRSLNAMTQK